MASVFKPTITRWVGPDGKRCQPNARGATKRTTETKKYYAKGVPGWPKRKKVPLATDKRVAQRMLDDLVRRAERGYTDLPDAIAGRTLLADLLGEFEADLALGLASRSRSRRKPSPDQVALTVGRVRDLLTACRFVTPADLNDAAPTTLARHLASRLGLARRDGGISSQTANFLLSAARRFAWWLSAKKRCPVRADLFEAVPGYDAKGERVHARRRIAPAELAHLLAVTRGSTWTFRGLTGEDRFHLYLTAFGTGFRAGELASLTPDSFDLDADPPTVALAGKKSKNRKGATQPLPGGVAAQLRVYLRGKRAGVPVWPGKWAQSRSCKAAKMLRGDLKAAGIAYKVETPDGPAFADFHALRHSFVSGLAESGVGVKEAQLLARHSDPKLTLNVYTHSSAAQLAGAVDRLRLPGGTEKRGPFDHLTREQVEAALALALVTLHSAGLVAPMVVPAVASGGGRPETTGHYSSFRTLTCGQKENP